MDSNELRRRQLAVIEVTNRPGWNVVRTIAEDMVKLMERQAIDEESDERGAALRREAKAARKFLNQLWSQIEITSRAEVPDEDTAAVDDEYEIAM